MVWILKKAIDSLQRRKSACETELECINASIKSLSLLETMNGAKASATEKDEEREEKYAEKTPREKPPTVKGFVRRKINAGLRFSYEAMHPVGASIEYIRSCNREMSCRELFDHFCSLGGYPKANRKRYYGRFYQALFGAAKRKKGLVVNTTHDASGRKVSLFGLDFAVIEKLDKMAQADIDAKAKLPAGVTRTEPAPPRMPPALT